MTATAEELLSRCDIAIHGSRIAANEPAFLGAVMARVAHHATQATHIDLYCTTRRVDGWIEWSLRVQYTLTRGITIGAIQRKPGDEVEFHS